MLFTVLLLRNASKDEKKKDEHGGNLPSHSKQHIIYLVILRLHQVFIVFHPDLNIRNLKSMFFFTMDIDSEPALNQSAL